MERVKTGIISKEVWDKYESVYFANEEQTIYIVSKRFREELKYNYVRTSDGKLLLNEWYVTAGDFINGTAIVVTRDGTHKIIAEDGTIIKEKEYAEDIIHYYYGTFITRYKSFGKSIMYEILNINGDTRFYDRVDSIQPVEISKLLGRQPKYFWIMKRGKYNFINSKGMYLLEEGCDGFEECDNKQFLHVWYDIAKSHKQHKYIRISDGEVITEGDFKKVTKISHGMYRVENTFGYSNILGYNQQLVFSSWHKSINVIFLEDNRRVCYLVSDENEDETVRYIYNSEGKKIVEVDNVLSVTNESWIKVEHKGKCFYVDSINGSICK